MKVKVIPYEALLGGLYPTNSRSGSCAAPVPYPQGEEVDVPALPLLLDAFVRGANIDPDNEEGRRRQKSSLHFLASVFANVSTVRAPLDNNTTQIHVFEIHPFTFSYRRQ